MRYAFASFFSMRHTRWTDCKAHAGTHWEMYVDLYDEGQAEAQVGVSNMRVELQASESFSRLVAYASPYLFWSMVTCVGLGLVALQ